MYMVKKLVPLLVVPLGFLLIGFVSATIVFDYREKNCEKSYTFINAEVICDKPGVIDKTGYASVQGELEKFIANEKAAERADEVSVYFRDLHNGPIFGIDETADFAPASLLKVPLALVYLTQAERTPGLLGEKLSVANPQWNFVQTFPAPEEINPNAPHAVEELLYHMLSRSDNNAYGVLQTYLYEVGQKERIAETFLELGFLNPDDITDEVLSVRRYAGIFRALYNVSYLNAELSEKMLTWLADSYFDQGLMGGVPDGITVAHKFGERFTEDGTKQLHDCGIIYFPENPYLLCVMTRGDSFEELAAVISHISKTVYDEVESRRL